jgi:thiol-disulfide isomerase/thioredoxin
MMILLTLIAITCNISVSLSPMMLAELRPSSYSGTAPDSVLARAYSKWQTIYQLRFRLHYELLEPDWTDTMKLDAEVFLSPLQNDSYGYKVCAAADFGTRLFYDGKQALLRPPGSDTALIVITDQLSNVPTGAFTFHVRFPSFEGKELWPSLLKSTNDRTRTMRLGQWNGESAYFIETTISPSAVIESAIRTTVILQRDTLLVCVQDEIHRRTKEGSTVQYRYAAISDVQLNEDADLVQMQDSCFPSGMQYVLFNVDSTLDRTYPLLNTAVPRVTLEAMQGGSAEVPGHGEEVLVIDFWYWECPPCRRLLAEIPKLQDAFNEKPVRFLSVYTGGEEPARLEKKLNNTIDRSTVFMGSKDITELFAVQSFPTLIIVDKEGIIQTGFEGFSGTDGDLERIVRAIQKQLDRLGG